MDNDSGALNSEPACTQWTKNTLIFSSETSYFFLCVCVWTETSAGLQRILQEIQPRDTNDFFMSARELDTQPGDDHAQTQKTHTPSLDTGVLEIIIHHNDIQH